LLVEHSDRVFEPIPYSSPDSLIETLDKEISLADAEQRAPAMR
jgi:hypothetical protein